MTGTSLLIRADAAVAMGTGHVMRCLALAQAWQDSGGRAVFALAQSTPAIEARLAAESCEVLAVTAQAGSAEDAEQTIELAGRAGAEWIVVDGYQFGVEYQAALKRAGLKILFVDDYGHAGYYSADLLLNQNAYANQGMYTACASHTRLLLGTRYCLLRREFSAWRGWKREIVRAGRRVLVTMGGSDPDNVTGVVMEALGQLPDIEATVVVGGSNPHFEDLQQRASIYQNWLRLEKSVTNMPELMARADIAIAGAGTTCWEMCRLQLPMALIDLAENQKPIAQALDGLGAAIHLGGTESVTADGIAKRAANLLASERQRATLAERCGALVDGLGAERVRSELGRA
jgi:UDP-2,4-diacetamido-2,4,6-trideoxy-beta-L-altropyranose hydrolase